MTLVIHKNIIFQVYALFLIWLKLMLNIFTTTKSFLIRMKIEAGHFLNITGGFLSLSYGVHVKWDSLFHMRWKICTYINLYIFYINLGRFVLASASRVWCPSCVQTNVLLSTMATRPSSAYAWFLFHCRDCWVLWIASSHLWWIKRLLCIIIKVVEKG